MIRALAALALSALPALAGPVERVDPATLPPLAGRLDFEALPLAPEPGYAWEGPLAAPGLALGERFAGQAVEGRPHDRIAGAPRAPLALAFGPPGQNLSTAFHAGFGSNALFALGPAGFPAVAARGEGAVALLFAADTAALALALHADYADPLGARPPPGRAFLTFHDRAGRVLDRHEIALGHGVMTLGFRAAAPGFAGVTLETDDPGGLALDDIRYPLAGLGS